LKQFFQKEGILCPLTKHLVQIVVVIVAVVVVVAVGVIISSAVVENFC
jgi:hypothetical protein